LTANRLASPVSRRLIPGAAIAATVLAAGALAGNSASAALAVRPAAGTTAIMTTAIMTTATVTTATAAPQGGPHRQAYDPATGSMVTVYQPTATTPVHPEQLTHPGDDAMGSVTGQHGGGRAGHGPAGGSGTSATAPAVAGLPGIDVSSYQGNLSWGPIAPHISFAYAKATEGTYYTNPDFANQYNGPYNQGITRGAYHFAIPSNSPGAAQADYFAKHGGGWSGDGRTLPGALDMEYNPYGAECYGLTKAQMTSWIWSFVNEYAFDAGTYPVIYSTYNWWTACTSSDPGFAGYSPFWIARYSASAGTLPAGYGFYTFWQYASSGSEPGDQDVFNGTATRLKDLAAG
jgi:GH25 family lysozyme M1 (1,4-beta-N-acetylmuramidase)